MRDEDEYAYASEGEPKKRSGRKGGGPATSKAKTERKPRTDWAGRARKLERVSFRQEREIAHLEDERGLLRQRVEDLENALEVRGLAQRACPAVEELAKEVVVLRREVGAALAALFSGRENVPWDREVLPLYRKGGSPWKQPDYVRMPKEPPARGSAEPSHEEGPTNAAGADIVTGGVRS